MMNYDRNLVETEKEKVEYAHRQPASQTKQPDSLLLGGVLVLVLVLLLLS